VKSFRHGVESWQRCIDLFEAYAAHHTDEVTERMSDSTDKVSEEGPLASNVADLPDAGERNEPSPAPEETRSGGRGWMLLCLVLLALLVLSGGLNFFLRSEQGALASETETFADMLDVETKRAAAAEQEVSRLRSALGDVHANMTSVQESLARIVATTAGTLESPPALASDDTLEAGGEAASERAAAFVEAGSSVLQEESDAAGSELPEVGAPAPGETAKPLGREEAASSGLSEIWNRTRDAVSGSMDWMKGGE
jgi:hypothetical protein